MKIRAGKEARWKRIQNLNADGYSKRVLNGTIAWADEMERHIAKGVKVAAIAQETVKNVGITRESFGVIWATRTLCEVWEHGKELGAWMRDAACDKHKAQAIEITIGTSNDEG